VLLRRCCARSCLESGHRIKSLTGADEMKINATIAHWAAATALAGACIAASGATPGEGSLVWVDNESFGFEPCAGAESSAEQAAAALAALRERAAADLERALRVHGVTLGAERQLLITPLSGALACRSVDAQITFRVSATGPRALTIDMPVRADAADATASAGRALPPRQADELARRLADAATRAASL
jgi:hypothetical protein